MKKILYHYQHKFHTDEVIEYEFPPEQCYINYIDFITKELDSDEFKDNIIDRISLWRDNCLITQSLFQHFRLVDGCGSLKHQIGYARIRFDDMIYPTTTVYIRMKIKMKGRIWIIAEQEYP